MAAGPAYPQLEQVYRDTYKESIFDAVSGEASAKGKWGLLLKNWLTSEGVDSQHPEDLVEQLHGATKKDDVFPQVMANISHRSYAAVSELFQQRYSLSLRDHIAKVFAGDDEYAFLLCHDYLIDPVRAVAAILNQAMKGSGTNDIQLIYASVLFANKAAPSIQQVFSDMSFGELLPSIQKELKGTYEDAMLALWMGMDMPTPVVVAMFRGEHPFNAAETAQIDDSRADQLTQEIQTACEGKGCDEKRLIQLTRPLNRLDRQKVVEAFERATGKKLPEVLKSELSGKLRDLLIALYSDYLGYWAGQLNDAVKGLGTNEKKLIDLVIMAAGPAYPQLEQVYRDTYKESIFDAVSGEASAKGKWGLLLKNWLTSEGADSQHPEDLVEQLHGATKKDDVFPQVMANISHRSYAAVSELFQQRYSLSLRDHIAKVFAGDDEYAFLLCHDYLIDPVRAVAAILKISMKGIGTNDDQLRYCTVLFKDRAERSIQEVYSQMNLGNLKKDLQDDLKGIYEDAMLLLWGCQ
uniref:Annexin 15 n=1 Tax=Spironucleus vortens TaxID=58336 RepID=A0A142C683_SPIVO|nr:annexin 15 [Spironucleus vortens]